MPEAGLNCIVCLGEEPTTPQCPAALVRASWGEETSGGGGGSTATTQAKLLALSSWGGRGGNGGRVERHTGWALF